MKHLLRVITPLLLLAAVSFAQSPLPATKTTVVMVTIGARPGIAREQIVKLMPEEIRATVRLYLDGRIREWYSRTDGKGVVLIVNAGSVAEAKDLTESLPLSKANLVDHEYLELGPLAPLYNLLGAPAK